MFKSKNILLLIILFCICSSYFYLLHIISTNYHPTWSDEFFYYVNTLSFVQNNTLKAALTYSGEGSILFGADAHGFAYPLLHGMFAKLFGWHNLNFIVFNIMLILIVIVCYSLTKGITLYQKILIICSFLLFPFLPLYAFTYMQEVIHVFFASLLSILLYKISSVDKNYKYIYLYVLVTFLAGLFRSLWLFWLIGLIPFAKNKKQTLFYLMLLLLGIVFSFVVTKLIMEYIPGYFSSMIKLLQNAEFKSVVISLIKHFFKNIYFYFFSYKDGLLYLAVKYINISGVLYFAFVVWRKQTKISISLMSIGVVNFLLLFVIYDAFAWREIRSMSPIFYFYIPFIVFEITEKPLRYIYLVFLSFLFFFATRTTKEWIAEKNSIDLLENTNKTTAYKEIALKVPKNTTILIDYIPNDYTWELLDLPVQNKLKQPIRYIVQYYNVKKSKYNYILKKTQTDSMNTPVISNKYFVLIKSN